MRHSFANLTKNAVFTSNKGESQSFTIQQYGAKHQKRALRNICYMQICVKQLEG